MRASPPSLPAESVFRYDLQHELEIDLERLRKTACNDGDVVFILDDQTSIWAHSPLFYVASSNKLPADFGTVIGRSVNDRGTMVTLLSVPEDKRPNVEAFMKACYTQDTLLLLWEAMGGEGGYFSSRYGQMDAGNSRINPTLPRSMLPDFTINLNESSSEIDGSPGLSIKVHRFILDARIDYYRVKTHAELSLGEGTPMASNLSRTVFTDLSLWAIAMYVYCGMPSIIFDLDKNLEGYITEPTRGNASLNNHLRCSKLRAKGRLPAEGVENLLLQISRAANFLLIPQLEAWAHFQLYRLAHRFKCAGGGCTEIIPSIIEAVYRNDITDEWMFNTGITWLARYENIQKLWKWPLIKKPKVVFLLIEKIKDSNTKEVEENSLLRCENAIELFLRLWKLKQYTSMTSDSRKWDNDLIRPLMDHTIEVILEDLSPTITNILEVLVASKGFSKLATENLVDRIIKNACMKENYVINWGNIEKLIKINAKKNKPPKSSGSKRNSATAVKIPPPLTECQISYLETQVFKNTEPKIAVPDVAKDDIRKRSDSRLRGSATPFIPSRIPIPLRNLENARAQTDRAIISLPDNKQRPCGILSTVDQNCGKPKLEESESEKSFEAIVAQAKRQGFNIRRIISTPTHKSDEIRETRTGNRRSENRSFTSPTIGGAIPFRQQMKMTPFYDTNLCVKTS